MLSLREECFWFNANSCRLPASSIFKREKTSLISRERVMKTNIVEKSPLSAASIAFMPIMAGLVFLMLSIKDQALVVRMFCILGGTSLIMLGAILLGAVYFATYKKASFLNDEVLLQRRETLFTLQQVQFEYMFYIGLLLELRKKIDELKPIRSEKQMAEVLAILNEFEVDAKTLGDQFVVTVHMRAALEEKNTVESWQRLNKLYQDFLKSLRESIAFLEELDRARIRAIAS
jgi:hypothetical protein